MEINFNNLWSKIKNNKRLVLELILAFFCVISLYYNITSYKREIDTNTIKIIERLNNNIKKNEELIKQYNINIDSIHIENKYIINKIDGTLTSIKKLEKKRYEKINTINNSNVDSTISFLRDRYN